MMLLALLLLVQQTPPPLPKSCRQYHAAQQTCMRASVCNAVETDRLRKLCQKDGGSTRLIVIPPAQSDCRSASASKVTWAKLRTSPWTSISHSHD
jgi:hypothetical protein